MDVGTRYIMADAGGAYQLTGDWVLDGPDLMTEEGPETAVLLSLFTDNLALPDDVLPSTYDDDRRGWWATTAAPEGSFGSRLWLLAREKETEETRLRAIFYAEEALAWMITDEVADQVQVTAEWSVPGRLDLHVQIFREQRLIMSKPYPIIWQAVQASAI